MRNVRYKIVIVKDSQQQLAFIGETDDEHHEQPASQPAQPTAPTSHLADQARELVNRFYQLFHNTTQSFPSSKAIDQAIALIGRRGVDVAT